MVFSAFCHNSLQVDGGDKRDRTADLLNAIQALSQLSYTPKYSVLVQNVYYFSRNISICQQLFSENKKITEYFAFLLHDA